uniref:Uncharacterized protein n=1 Tax=Fagus sylvatica TaxID=28930 RepID=A0A2N9G3B9_FAGSY
MRKKRKRGEEQSDDAGGQEGSSPSQPPKAKAPKKGKSKNDRALQKAAGQVPQRHKHRNDSKQPWICAFLFDDRTVDEGDSVLKSGKDVRGGQVAEAVGKTLLLPEDMKVWQEKRSKHMLENLKRDSILVTKLEKKLDWEFTSSSQLQVENSELKDAITEAQAKVQKAEDEAQSYYDQGFNEAADSLQSQLRDECNKFFIQGWHKALDKAGVDDASELYDLAQRHRPYKDLVPEERDGEAGEDAAEDSMVPGSYEVLNEPKLVDDPEMALDLVDDRIQTVEFQEGEDDSDVEENIDVVD